MYKFSVPQRSARSTCSRTLLIAALFSSTLVSGAFAQDAKVAPSASASPGVKTTVSSEDRGEGEATADAAGPTEQEQEEAKLAFEAGTKAFGEESYEAALSEFKTALDKVPSAGS